MDSVWPVGIEDVLAARQRIRPYLAPTPLRTYAALDQAVGHGIHVLVKHEDANPTNTFKARNALSALTALASGERLRGVVGASRGNHGQALAWAGGLLGIPVTVCVPLGNNPDKNEAMRGFGATVVEHGKDYDEAITVAHRLEEEGRHLVHSTNNRGVIAGAATLAFEILEEAPRVDALVIAVGGGSQAVGALIVARALKPDLEVYAVQAERAGAIQQSWKKGTPVAWATADTFADGLATRNVYELTFPALKEGLADFVTVSEHEIAEAVRLFLRTTHHLSEGAGATGLAGLMALRDRLAGRTVGVVLSGSNIDQATLRRVVNGEI